MKIHRDRRGREIHVIPASVMWRAENVCPLFLHGKNVATSGSCGVTNTLQYRFDQLQYGANSKKKKMPEHIPGHACTTSKSLTSDWSV